MRVYVEGFGCTQNLGEANALRRSAEAGGHSLVADPSEADVGVLVTCGVIGATEARMVRRWKELADRIPQMVVTGCLVPLRTGLLEGEGRARTTFLPIREQSRLPQLLEELPYHDEGRSAPRRSASPPYDEGSPISEVPIAQGCTSHCTYCFSRLARGTLRSVPLSRVLADVNGAVERGAREVRLASLDTSCWGAERAGEARLPELLHAVAELPGEFMVRVGMMSPQSLLGISPSYFAVLDHRRFFQFLHLPVQSGSDEVLGAMRRGYTVEEFRRCVEAGRSRLPELMLSTDLIVGFPTESDADFAKSLRLVEELDPEVVNVTRFSPRPMTPAARLPPLRSRLVKERSRQLAALRMRTARRRLERWIGRTVPALPLERGPGGTTVARLPNYLPVVLPREQRLGEWGAVRVDGCRSTYLLGTPVTAELAPPL